MMGPTVAAVARDMLPPPPHEKVRKWQQRNLQEPFL